MSNIFDPRKALERTQAQHQLEQERRQWQEQAQMRITALKQRQSQAMDVAQSYLQTRLDQVLDVIKSPAFAQSFESMTRIGKQKTFLHAFFKNEVDSEASDKHQTIKHTTDDVLSKFARQHIESELFQQHLQTTQDILINGKTNTITLEDLIQQYENGAQLTLTQAGVRKLALETYEGDFLQLLDQVANSTTSTQLQEKTEKDLARLPSKKKGNQHIHSSMYMLMKTLKKDDKPAFEKRHHEDIAKDILNLSTSQLNNRLASLKPGVDMVNKAVYENLAGLGASFQTQAFIDSYQVAQAQGIQRQFVMTMLDMAKAQIQKSALPNPQVNFEQNLVGFVSGKFAQQIVKNTLDYVNVKQVPEQQSDLFAWSHSLAHTVMQAIDDKSKLLAGETQFMNLIDDLAKRKDEYSIRRMHRYIDGMDKNDNAYEIRSEMMKLVDNASQSLSEQAQRDFSEKQIRTEAARAAREKPEKAPTAKPSLLSLLGFGRDNTGDEDRKPKP